MCLKLRSKTESNDFTSKSSDSRESTFTAKRRTDRSIVPFSSGPQVRTMHGSACQPANRITHGFVVVGLHTQVALVYTGHGYPFLGRCSWLFPALQFSLAGVPDFYDDALEHIYMQHRTSSLPSMPPNIRCRHPAWVLGEGGGGGLQHNGKKVPSPAQRIRPL